MSFIASLTPTLLVSEVMIGCFSFTRRVRRVFVPSWVVHLCICVTIQQNIFSDKHWISPLHPPPPDLVLLLTSWSRSKIVVACCWRTAVVVVVDWHRWLHCSFSAPGDLPDQRPGPPASRQDSGPTPTLWMVTPALCCHSWWSWSVINQHSDLSINWNQWTWHIPGGVK